MLPQLSDACAAERPAASGPASARGSARLGAAAAATWPSSARGAWREAPGAAAEAGHSTVKRLTLGVRLSPRRKRGACAALAGSRAPAAGADGEPGSGGEAELPLAGSDGERTKLHSALPGPPADAGPRRLAGSSSPEEPLASSSGASLLEGLGAAPEVLDLKKRLASMEQQYTDAKSQLEASRQNHYLALRGAAAHEEAGQMRPVRKPAAPALVCQNARPESQSARPESQSSRPASQSVRRASQSVPQRGRAQRPDTSGLPPSLDPTRTIFCLKRQLAQCQQELRQSQAECREQRQQLEYRNLHLHNVLELQQRDKELQDLRREMQQLRRQHELELYELRQQLKQQLRQGCAQGPAAGDAAARFRLVAREAAAQVEEAAQKEVRFASDGDDANPLGALGAFSNQLTVEEEEDEEEDGEKAEEAEEGDGSAEGKSAWSKVASGKMRGQLRGKRSMGDLQASETAILERGLSSLRARWEQASQAQQLEEPASHTTQRFIEGMEASLRDMEFRQRVTELMDMRSPDEEEGKEADDVGASMALQYDEAFENAGGQEKAEPFFDPVNKLCRRLLQERPDERGRQDCGYEILGMSALYNATAKARPKLMREVRRIAAMGGGYAMCPDLKGRDRARAKALTKYGNDTACLTDLMRASIVYPNIESMYESFITILSDDLERYRHDWHLVEFNDRFQNVRDGYRDISMLFRADGMVGEVQLHVDQIVNAKKGGGHRQYKKQRLVNELIFEACVLNDEVQAMKLAIEFHSCASTVRDKNGRTALHYSCGHCSENAVRALLVNKANPWKPDNWGLLPFELAMVGGHFGTMELVLEAMKQKQPDDPKQTTRLVEKGFLVWVDRKIHDDGKRQAMQRKVFNPALALIEETASRRESAEGSWMRVGKLLIEVIIEHSAQSYVDSWFMKNAEAGDIPKVFAALEADFDPKVKWGSPSAMDKAIEGGHVELVTKLGEWMKANPSVKCLQVSSRESVHSHLKRAAQLSDPAYATAALAAKADPGHTKARAPGKRTPLMAFAAAGDLGMCKTLVDANAQAAGYDAHACSVLDYARSLGQSHVEEYLMELESFTDMPFKSRDGPPDLAMYIYTAVQDGCCGAISRMSRALTEAEKGSFKQSTVAEVLDCSFGPFQLSLLHLAVQAVGSLIGARREDGPDPAAQFCHALLLARADPTKQNARGESSLHAAASLGDEHVHELMMQHVPKSTGTDSPSARDTEDRYHVGTLARTVRRKQLREVINMKDGGLSANMSLVRATFESFRAMLALQRMEASFQEAHLTWAQLVLQDQDRASWRARLQERKERDEDGDSSNGKLRRHKGAARKTTGRPEGASRATRTLALDAAKPTTPADRPPPK